MKNLVSYRAHKEMLTLTPMPTPNFDCNIPPFFKKKSGQFGPFDNKLVEQILDVLITHFFPK